MMTLDQLGYDPQWESYREEQGLTGFDLGRVIAEHKERYIVKTEHAEFDAEIIGALRFSANNRADFPAVGDWVALTPYDDEKALIHAVLPRKTIIEREAVGRTGEKQIIATNIDVAFLMQAVDRDFNLNRIERYLTLCYSAKVKPVIVLTKTDLIDQSSIEEMVQEVKQRIQEAPVFAISTAAETGLAELETLIEKGKTYCLLGSSGVGKSTLTNYLAGQATMDTGAISTSTSKGKHVTSHRELVVLKNGGLLIDNPGMREVGIADASAGLEHTFDAILELADQCRYKDCTHEHEDGCAVLEAIGNGELDESSYANYLKLEREKKHFSATVAEKRQRDREFGKMVKKVLKVKDRYKK